MKCVVRVVLTAMVGVGVAGCDVQSVTYTDASGNSQTCTVAGPGNTDELVKKYCNRQQYSEETLDLIDRQIAEIARRYGECHKPSCETPAPQEGEGAASISSPEASPRLSADTIKDVTRLTPLEGSN